MKNCTWCSSELSRFRGNNYQSGDLCFSSPADKHPAPWGMVWKWYSFKRVKFHCFLHPPLPPLTTPLPLSLPLRFISQKCEHIFLSMGAKKKKKKRKRGTIKNMKGPSSQNIRHRKTTQSHDRIYQNWQVKVDCWVSIDWAIFHWESTGSQLSSRCTKPCCRATANGGGQRKYTEIVGMLQLIMSVIIIICIESQIF